MKNKMFNVSKIGFTTLVKDQDGELRAVRVAYRAGVYELAVYTVYKNSIDNGWFRARKCLSYQTFTSRDGIEGALAMVCDLLANTLLTIDGEEGNAYGSLHGKLMLRELDEMLKEPTPEPDYDELERFAIDGNAGGR